MSPVPLGESGDGRAAARVTIAGFDGPLDALLHLVRTGELDITGLPVVEVVRQCDAYVRLVQEIDLDAAGDHLVMAATLVHMKSRNLLPADPELLATEEIPDDELPGRLQIVVRELRQAAEQLQEREAAMELVYTRPAKTMEEFAGEQGIEADLYALVHAFQEILKRLGQEPEERRIARDRMSLMERVTWLIDTLTRDRRISFRSLFAGLEDRLACILTFLALLEVLRLRVARAFQSHHQADIMVVLAEDDAQIHPETMPIDA